MPIGVPKIPLRNPGEPYAAWVDIYSLLYRSRLLFLSQGVDSVISNQLISLMIYLSIENEKQELYLFINSPGGWIVPGMAIFDTMQFVKPNVHTVCMGLAASMGSFLLVGGEISKRISFPHARVMIHQPASYFFGAPVEECLLEAEELLKLRETITKVYAERTGKPVWVVHEDLERDVFMSATEAQAYGIVDFVSIPPKSKKKKEGILHKPVI
uniref:ATP-dependent Clp protease proteolytic subunit n=1 Tax=Erythropalum scandens TaxID=350427 RepID=A0A2H5AA16_ERYSC|nr:clp protease proteolytic subunit [Erythropalum scandens]AUG62871.1 clp protease proteolytic subunit [Erythropalum scandens]